MSESSQSSSDPENSPPKVHIASSASSNSAGYDIGVDPALFHEHFDDATLERLGSDRMLACDLNTTVTSVKDDDGSFILRIKAKHAVDKDTKFPTMTKDTAIAYVKKLLDGDPLALHPLELAMKRPALYWNLFYHVGGAEVVIDHDCSVTQAVSQVLMPEEDWSFLRKRRRRK